VFECWTGFECCFFGWIFFLLRFFCVIWMCGVILLRYSVKLVRRYGTVLLSTVFLVIWMGFCL